MRLHRTSDLTPLNPIRRLLTGQWRTFSYRPAVPALILCLTNTATRTSAFKNLVPGFTNLSPDPTVRETVIRMLGAMGDNARAALPTITSALNDTNEYVRSSVPTHSSASLPKCSPTSRLSNSLRSFAVKIIPLGLLRFDGLSAGLPPQLSELQRRFDCPHSLRKSLIQPS
jgi:hypothetical protein